MNKEIKAYLIYRRIIGIIGILLPFVLLVGASLQKSISYYYFTNMRDIFSGALLIVGVFLVIYSIYSLLDNIISTVAGIAAIITALFPTFTDLYKYTGFLEIKDSVSGVIHTSAAAIFFICLGFMALFLFTRGPRIQTDNKRKRNIIYIITGSVIFLVLIVLIFAKIFHLDSGPFVFIAETIMLISFGVSWFIKGETLFKDSK